MPRVVDDEIKAVALFVNVKPVEPGLAAWRATGFAVPEVTLTALLPVASLHFQFEPELPPFDIADERYCAPCAAVSAKMSHLPFPFGVVTLPELASKVYEMLPIVTDGLPPPDAGPVKLRLAVSFVGVLAVSVSPFTAIVWPKFALVGVDEITLEVPVACVPALAVRATPLTVTVPVVWLEELTVPVWLAFVGALDVNVTDWELFPFVIVIVSPPLRLFVETAPVSLAAVVAPL